MGHGNSILSPDQSRQAQKQEVEIGSEL